MSVSVTVYIPTLNSESFLPGALASLNESRHLADRILVIDGGSRDRTCEIARSWGASLVHNPRKHVASARRIAVEQCRSDVLVSIDSDCHAGPDWLHRIVSHFVDPDLDGVGGPYVCPRPATLVEKVSAGVFEAIMQFPETPVCVDAIGMKGAFVEGNCAFRHSVLVGVGSYRNCFTNHAEGIDVFWRLIGQGKKLLFDPELWVEHRGYPRTVAQFMRRNYHFGWSSTKLSKYTLQQSRFDPVPYRQLVAAAKACVAGSPAPRSEARLLLLQLGAFIFGKAVSSMWLRHFNL